MNAPDSTPCAAERSIYAMGTPDVYRILSRMADGRYITGAYDGTEIFSEADARFWVWRSTDSCRRDGIEHIGLIPDRYFQQVRQSSLSDTDKIAAFVAVAMLNPV